LQVSSRLVVNRTAIKTEPEALGEWVENFRKATA
jgi:ATP phosphoribosyltransferase